VEASDLGGGVIYYDDEPPANDDAGALLLDKSRLASLQIIDPGVGKRMSNRLEAVAGLASAAGGTLLVEGWVEGPCAEGADLRGLSRLMMDFYDDPDFVRELFDFTTRQAISFALAQIRAGADLIGVGDAASSLMGPDIFVEFTLKHHRPSWRQYTGQERLPGSISAETPRNSCLSLSMSPTTSSTWIPSLPVSKARAALGPDRVLLGNIDTVAVVRGGTPEDVHRTLSDCQRDAGSRWIVGAGCELPGDSPEANVLAMGTFARGNIGPSQLLLVPAKKGGYTAPVKNLVRIGIVLFALLSVLALSMSLTLVRRLYIRGSEPPGPRAQVPFLPVPA
jgi:uroporphyrinogen-III decarboxylase